jgi:hypothetical protein
MPRVDIYLDSEVQPDVIRRALLDFSDRRPEIWPGITPDLYQVVAVGDTWADIREGTRVRGGAVWAVEHYDWSDPETVKWTVKESNRFVPGSWVSATITPKWETGSHIHIIWNRKPKSFVGRLLTLLIRLSRGRPIATSFQKGIDRL